MLSKCANPVCLARFLYLSQGRIFNIQIESSVTESRPPSNKIEHFWLCESCARVMRVVRENGVVITRPLFLQLTAGTPEAPPRRWPAAEKSLGSTSDGPHQPQKPEPGSIPFGHIAIQIPRK